MGKNCYKFVNFENFREGLTVPGNFEYKYLKGRSSFET